ncbi:MAG: septum formation initiator family protein [Gammaproteobacteria bacterium]
MRRIRITPLVLILIGLFLLIQYKLWFESDGILDLHRLNKEVQTQKEKTQALEEKNQALAHSITQLKKGNAAIEEQARSDLGLVKPGEEYYQIVESPHGDKKDENSTQ